MKVAFYRKIKESILRDIHAGILKPGDRIPTVRAISEQWGVSAIVGLRVFKELNSSGLVEKREGEGIPCVDRGRIQGALHSVFSGDLQPSIQGA